MNSMKFRTRRVAARLAAALAVTATALGVLTALSGPASAEGFGVGTGPAGNAPSMTVVGTDFHGIARTVEVVSQVVGPGMVPAAGVSAQVWTRRAGAGQQWHLAATAIADTKGDVSWKVPATTRYASWWEVRVPAQGGLAGGQGNPLRLSGVHLAHCIAAVSSRVWVTGGRPGVGSWRAQLVPGAAACARPGLPVRATVTLQRAVREHHWHGVWHATVAVRRVVELVDGGQVVGHRLGAVTVTRASRTVR